jgi:hypothetical protein
LQRLLGGKDGWILVRPDAHVAFTTDRPGSLWSAAPRALGWAAPQATK